MNLHGTPRGTGGFLHMFSPVLPRSPNELSLPDPEVSDPLSRDTAKEYQSMKKAFLFLTVLMCLSASSLVAVNPAIEKHKIVVFCENLHPEMTQPECLQTRRLSSGKHKRKTARSCQSFFGRIGREVV